jgi:hypothetical protein
VLALPKAKKQHLPCQRQSQRLQLKLLRQQLTQRRQQLTPLRPQRPPLQHPPPRAHLLPNETSLTCKKPASAGFFTALSRA